MSGGHRVGARGDPYLLQPRLDPVRVSVHARLPALYAAAAGARHPEPATAPLHGTGGRLDRRRAVGLLDLERLPTGVNPGSVILSASEGSRFRTGSALA